MERKIIIFDNHKIPRKLRGKKLILDNHKIPRILRGKKLILETFVILKNDKYKEN